MSWRMIWIHAGLVALFGGGVAAGILYHHGARRAPAHPASFGEDHAAHFLDHFRHRLDLSDEQGKHVKNVLDRLHVEMTGLTREFHREFTALRASAWTDIRATLDEGQRAEFERLTAELEARHSAHASPSSHAADHHPYPSPLDEPPKKR